MAGYEALFARCYDQLTTDVDYPAKAAYLMELVRRFGKAPGLVLDLACGTGSLAAELSRLGAEVIAVDASPDMLAQAAAKNEGLSNPVLYLCQEMENLDLYGTVEAAFCTLDSLNHLPDAAAVGRVLERLRLFIEPGGLFLFDMNTPYKHEKVLAGSAFVRETEEVFCVWQNSLAPDGALDICLDLFERHGDGSYTRFSEEIRERAYPEEEMEALLEAHGFRLLDRFGDYTRTAPGAQEQRILYIAQRE